MPPCRPDFQHRTQIFIRRAGVGRGFQHHQCALFQMPGDGFAGINDVGNIGSRFLFNGVGTQMITALTSRIRLKSVLAENDATLDCLVHHLCGNVLDEAFTRLSRSTLFVSMSSPKHRRAQSARTSGTTAIRHIPIRQWQFSYRVFLSKIFRHFLCYVLVVAGKNRK